MFLARLLVLFSLVCISCAHSSFEQKQLKHALDFATSNRLELEILLQHYTYDSLKLEAAKFLIRICLIAIPTNREVKWIV